MRRSDFESLSTYQLEVLLEKIAAILMAKISAEKKLLEDRLAQLNGSLRFEQSTKNPDRRPYPAVLPKYRNPEQPSETWAGRGKKPRWVIAQLRSGKQIDDFLIDS
jgi:DNA-binding protein H-NS